MTIIKTNGVSTWEEADPKKLSAEKIENWRQALVLIFGAYVLYMTDEQIQLIHDQIQRKFDDDRVSP